MPTFRRSSTYLFLLALVCPFSAAQAPLRLKAVTPCRLVDTRSGQPIQGGTAQIFNLPNLAQAGGAGGQCAPFDLSSALAYSLNVTLDSGGTRVSYLTIWPTGEPQPTVSLMNSFDGRTKANAAIVPAGNGGAVSVYVSNTTNILIDINAYFASAADSTALAFFPLPPCRIIDTRNSGGPLPGHQEHDFSIPGNCGIPSDAQAYSFNITALPSGPLGYVTVWPTGEPQPVVSTLNDYTGTNVANAAIVPAGSENKTAIYPSATTNLLIDTNGYFAPANSASNPLSLYTITPCRVLDTRQGFGPFNGTIPIGIVGSSCGIPNVAEAFTLNATVLPSGPLGYLSLWPEGSGQPMVSTLNAPDAAVTSNMAIVPAGSGNESISAFASGSNPTHLILDLASYFAPVTNLDVLTLSLPDGTQGSGYSVPLAAVGGVPPYTWTKTAGNLPPGLSVSSSGLIQGTATSTGNYSFTVQATDSNSPAATATANLQITVNGSAGNVVINTSSLPNGSINTPYSTLLSANGGITPYSWTISSGSLPVGLTMDARSGLISGTPGAAGITSVTMKVTDVNNNTASQPLTLSIDTGAANGTLNGMYAISFTGYGQGNFLVAAGSITADGSGHITAGETDVNNSSGGVEHDTITGGSYSMNSDGLGQINWTDDHGGNVQMLVSAGAAEQMRVIAYNQNGSQGTWGAGVLRQQNPSNLNLPALAGDWAFGAQGADSGINPMALDGAYTQNPSGGISNGLEDINDFGNHVQATFSGSTGSVDSSGRTIAQISIGNQQLHYAAYVVSGSELMYVPIDAGGSILTGNLRRQNVARGGWSLANLRGNSVSGASREQHPEGGPVSEALAVLAQADGNGNLAIDAYGNSAGTFGQIQETATYTVDSNTGRTVINLTGGGTFTCYLVATNEEYCIQTAPSPGENNHGALVYFYAPQAAGPFSAASFSGQYLGGSLPQYVPSTPNQIDSNFTDGIGAFYSTYTQSGQNGTEPPQTLTGTYTVDPTTGTVIIMSGGNTAYAGFIVGSGQADLVSAGPNPLTLIEVKSSAP